MNEIASSMSAIESSAESPDLIRRADYKPFPYHLPSIELDFRLDRGRTVVTALCLFEKRDETAEGTALELDGEDLELLSLRLDGESVVAASSDGVASRDGIASPASVSSSADPVSAGNQGGKRAKPCYRLKANGLTVLNPPAQFRLSIEVAIDPQRNLQLSGLYVSRGILITQCEAQGFRRMMFAPDRPDVMSRYTVRLHARRDEFPVLLSNGNLVERGGDESHHFSTWVDPFPKPSYLFALVAGNLECNESPYTTQSGRQVTLQVWCEPGQKARTQYAMESLKRSIAWDEQRYGLELDLDRFMIVAVSDFNMGAMENKGLNIFNTKYLFADPRIATDDDFARIESIVGHEYFHNWTGNRVTCRDWFQLTLKEGLTVYRDQQFSADCMAAELEKEGASEQMARSARAVHRIETVRVLRAMQFAEDAGPMSHPIRPDSYQAIDNFYTATVYEKGAEVIRMLATLVGDDGFRRGMDLYFDRHDGQAVTCDDFVAAIADANGRDLSQFMRWYDTAGTPQVLVERSFDKVARRFTLTLRQYLRSEDGTPRTPAVAMQIPIAFGLLDRAGHEVHQGTIELTQPTQSFEFEGLDEAPVPSLLRQFSAPVTLQMEQPDMELAFLLKHDGDAFNRWEAGQRLMTRAIIGSMRGQDVKGSIDALIDALGESLRSPTLSEGMRQQLLVIPTEGTLTEQLDRIEPLSMRRARVGLRESLARQLAAPLGDAMALADRARGPYALSVQAAARRALSNTAMTLLASIGDARAIERAQRLAREADNMTDRFAALAALSLTTPELRDADLAAFEREYANEASVMDKWFMLQATMQRLGGDRPVIDRVRALLDHPAYSATNPNKVRALVTSFCSGNLAEFHQEDGSGYAFWAEQVLQMDARNPQLAARLARAMDRHMKFSEPVGARMREALQRVLLQAHSPDVREIVQRALKGR